jgi:thiol-disulfide isomerase/thioredoxin
MKISRRSIVAATLAAPALGLRAQGPAGTAAAAAAAPSASSIAAQEARAPALPALGSTLALRPVPLLGGGRFEPQSVQGKVLVVYWWASWCPFCAVQSPHVEALWRKQRTRGLEVLALSIDRRPEDALAYLKKKGYTFPAAMLTPEVAAALPKPKGLPVTVVRGRDGKVVFAESGEMFPEDIEGLAKFL